MFTISPQLTVVAYPPPPEGPHQVLASYWVRTTFSQDVVVDLEPTLLDLFLELLMKTSILIDECIIVAKELGSCLLAGLIRNLVVEVDVAI